MSNKEAIEELRYIAESFVLTPKGFEALDMAFKALEEQALRKDGEQE